MLIKESRKNNLTKFSTPTLALPLQGGGNVAPSPLQGEGWDGGGNIIMNIISYFAYVIFACSLNKRAV